MQRRAGVYLMVDLIFGRDLELLADRGRLRNMKNRGDFRLNSRQKNQVKAPRPHSSQSTIPYHTTNPHALV